MIIKLYSQDEILYIIEDVRDAVAYPFSHGLCLETWETDGLKTNPECDVFAPCGIDDGFAIEHKDGSNKVSVKIIEYKDTKTLEGRRIYVQNRAYICNDDGKTLEIVKN